MDASTQIHISRDGQNFGPYSLEQTRHYVQSGQILPTDFAWYEGAQAWAPVSNIPELAVGLPTPPPMPMPLRPQLAPEPAYHHVSVVKFIIYSICSFGLYLIYWFYKNWRYVRDRDGSDIRPAWRAIFSPIWCFHLAKDVAATHGNANTALIGLVPIAYLAALLSQRLPEPYDWIGLASFVPLIYLVVLIHQINRQRGARGPFYARVRVHHALLCLLGALGLGLAILGTAAGTPSTKVLMGGEIDARNIQWLRAAGVLNPDEIVEFFYSTGILSIKGEGYLATDKRVVAYESASNSEKPSVQSAFYKEIKDIKVEYSNSSLSDTEVTISKGEDEEFSLMLSIEDKLDRKCVQRLMHLWESAKNSLTPPADP
jgi:hypothetical protein